MNVKCSTKVIKLIYAVLSFLARVRHDGANQIPEVRLKSDKMAPNLALQQ